MSQLPRQPMMIDPVTGLPIPGDPGVDPRMQFPGSMPTQPGLMGKLSNAFGGPQGLLNFGASLMAQSGPSPVKHGFGSILGNSLLGNQQFQRESNRDMLEEMLLRTKIAGAGTSKKGKLQEDYEYAKSQGFTGTIEEWKRIASAQPTTPAGIQEYEYFTKLPPEEQKRFLSLQRSPVVPQLSIVGGVPTLVDRTNATTTPLSTQQAEIEAVVKKALAESQAKATGTATGEALGGLQKKAVNAMTVLEQLDLAEPLIDVATGSTAGAAADKVAAFFGKSLQGDQAIAELKVLQAALMTNMPRMEGPQSDRDVQLYREAAGEIGDPNVPRARKRAAMNMIRAMNEKYAEASAARGGGSNIDALLDKYAPKK